MKKLLTLCVVYFSIFNVHAQITNKIAVLDFKASVGISQSEVDGIAAIFTTYFSPQGWVLVERSQIDKVINEQGFQKSSITEQQMVRVGKILNLKKIVVGDVNIISGSYNIDVRIIDVETGVITAKDGAVWNSGTTYRELMKSLATRLATGIANAGQNYSATAPTSQATNVIVLYDYLKIHPKNLGIFTSIPTTIISMLNKNKELGYNTWRLPTQEELELILSNADKVPNITASQQYMTSNNPSNSIPKAVRLVTTDKTAAEQEQARQAATRETERTRELARQKAMQTSEQRRAMFAELAKNPEDATRYIMITKYAIDILFIRNARLSQSDYIVSAYNINELKSKGYQIDYAKLSSYPVVNVFMMMATDEKTLWLTDETNNSEYTYNGTTYNIPFYHCKFYNASTGSFEWKFGIIYSRQYYAGELPVRPDAFFIDEKQFPMLLYRKIPLQEVIPLKNLIEKKYQQAVQAK